MSVRKRGKRWIVDIDFEYADGTRERIRKVSPVQTRRGAERYERDVRMRLLDGTYCRKEIQPEPPAPTVREWAPVWLKQHTGQAKLRPSYVKSVDGIIRQYLSSDTVGDARMDEVDTAVFATLRQAASHLSAKRMNNILTVLSVMRRCWFEWRGQQAPYVKAGLAQLDEKEAPFYPVGDFDRLVEAAEGLGPVTTAITLLGGDAGLRMSEVRALYRTDLSASDSRRWVRVQRSIDDDEEYAPKGRKFRTVRLTRRLGEVLDAVPRQLRDLHLFLDHEGRVLTRKMVRGHLNRAQRVAGLPETGFHILRHTFCSHLVMAGQAIPVIKDLAGHKSITTTMRYAHLAPGAGDQAIAALERRGTMAAHRKRRARKRADSGQ